MQLIDPSTLTELSDALGDELGGIVDADTSSAFEAVRGQLDGIVAGVEHVRGVINEVAIAPNSSLTARGNDTLITSNVKARFVDAGRFSAHNVKVVTEANVVVLMGLVTRAEADAAAEVARTSQGVRKVVRVFEYISDEEARRLDNPTGARR